MIPQRLLPLVCLLLAACSLAPSYHRPAVPAATTYRETGNWQPTHSSTLRTDWWQALGDPTLNNLEQTAAVHNQNLLASIARLDEARAIARAQAAAQWPTVGLAASHQNAHVSNHTPLFPVESHPSYQSNLINLDASYEIDLWGAIKNAIIASDALAHASADDLAALQLSIQAELAMDYANLRALDTVLQDNQKLVDNWQQNLRLTQILVEHREANVITLSEASFNLDNAHAQLTDLQRQRSQTEHAIALIIGSNPDTFTLPANDSTPPLKPLQPAPDLPSTLLERRPDIASAEQQVIAANANIGVARAAFFPVFGLSGNTGYENTGYSNWITAPNRLWSFGPTAALNLFDGGRLQALSDQAHAQWRATVANYRNTVLSAWKDVEDQLIALHKLHDEDLDTRAAAQTAQHVLDLTQTRLVSGIDTQFDVLSSERTLLNAQLTQTTIHLNHIDASILLVKALGGGWQNPQQSSDKK